MSKGQTPDAQRVTALTGALQNTAAHDPPLIGTSKMAQLFREGTDMGLLGLHLSTHHVYATDGSLEDGHMGTGFYIVRSGKALRCRVGRSRESRTSLRVETGASYLALEHGRDIAAPIFILTDSANHLQELEDWVGPGKYQNSPLIQRWRYRPRGAGALAPSGHFGLPHFFCKSASPQGRTL